MPNTEPRHSLEQPDDRVAVPDYATSGAHGCGPGEALPVNPSPMIGELHCPHCGNRLSICRCRITSEPRHGCGPGESLPPDTVTEGARLPRRTREELILEVNTLKNYPPMEEMWDDLQRYHQRLAGLAGQIAELDK